MTALKTGAFFFGGVEMDDAGAGPPAPMDRRFTNAQAWDATQKYVNSALHAETLGYDSFWTTEHHFQYEGYEVIPNGDPGRQLDAVGDHLVALVLEVVLGGPERVEPQRFGMQRRVDVLLGGIPRLGVGVSPVHRGGRAGTGVVHLDAAEEEGSSLECGHLRAPVRVSGVERLGVEPLGVERLGVGGWRQRWMADVVVLEATRRPAR